MPRIAEIKEFDGAVWVRVGVPGEFPSGIALWTPEDQENHAKQAERAAYELAANMILNRWRAYCLSNTAAQALADEVRALVMSTQGEGS